MRRRRYDSIYSSPRWRKIRGAHLKAHPWCARHHAIGVNVRVVDIHHVQALSAGGALDGELESLCHACHAQVTRAENTGSPTRPPKPPVSDVDPETGIRRDGWW